MLGRQHPEPLSERQWICRIIRDHRRLFLPTAIQENLAHTSWVRRGLHMLVFCLALKVSKTEWFLFCYIYSETLLGFDIMVFVRFWRWSRYGPGLCWLAIWADRNGELVLNGMGWLFLAVWWVIIGIFITCELFKSKIVSFLKIFGSLVQGFNLFEMLVFFRLEKQLFRLRIRQTRAHFPKLTFAKSNHASSPVKTFFAGSVEGGFAYWVTISLSGYTLYVIYGLFLSRLNTEYHVTIYGMNRDKDTAEIQEQ